MENIKFNSIVLEKGEDKQGKFIILNKSEFYPDGKGGQIGDRGKIGSSKVLFVRENGDRIIHYIDKFPEDNDVLCEVDMKRRGEISALHTAQHILSAILLSKFHIDTAAFHMSEENCTIDISSFSVTDAQIENIERLVNTIVFENLPVKKYFVNEEKLSSLHLRKKTKIKGKIRIVEIPGVDLSLCGGTHVDYTGEIGLIKIVKTEKVKKQFTRIYFTARMRTLKAFRQKQQVLKELSALLSSGEEELSGKVGKILSEIKVTKKENKKMLNQAIEQETEKILQIDRNGLIICQTKLGKSALTAIAIKLYNTDKTALVYCKENDSVNFVFTKGKIDINLKDLYNSISDKFHTKGFANDKFISANAASNIWKEVSTFIKTHTD